MDPSHPAAPTGRQGDGSQMEFTEVDEQPEPDMPPSAAICATCTG
ncbi:hypothetical protein ACH47C_22640 [Streptomyces rishiriensis]|nr:hypothetical protein [Streptomyces rishiriensis]